MCLLSGRAWLLALLLASVACTTGRRESASYRYPHREAHGRPMTCPQVRLPPLRDGGVSPDAARCSYSDAQGSQVVGVAGKVVAEGGPGDPGTGVGGIFLSIHRMEGASLNLDDPGRQVAHARTDPQGRYSVSGTFVPGNYAAIARDPEDDHVLAWRIFIVAENAIGRMDGILVTIPLDPNLAPEAEK